MFSQSEHPNTDKLILYAYQNTLPSDDFAAIEEHLLVCELCQLRLREMDRQIGYPFERRRRAE